jgi:hypothetical protein
MSDSVSFEREKRPERSTAKLTAPWRLFLLFALVFLGISRNFQTLVPLSLLFLFTLYIFLTEKK